jgi:hypothetical protein
MIELEFVKLYHKELSTVLVQHVLLWQPLRKYQLVAAFNGKDKKESTREVFRRIVDEDKDMIPLPKGQNRSPSPLKK